MASAYLGPERHKPLAVVFESYLPWFRIPTFDGQERFRFGKEFEKNLFSLIHEHLELGVTDRLVYVGELKGSLSQAIEDHFCLVHPVQNVVPGHFHYTETHGGDGTLPARLAKVGAEEYFQHMSEYKSPDNMKFDRILVNDCIRYLAQPRTAFKNMIASLAPGGKMLIIHRTAELNSLPYFCDARHRLTEIDIPYTDILKDLQACNLDVTCELECLLVCMPKRKWLAMVRDRFPTEIEILSNTEVISGIRELSQGILKYQEDMVEFEDRLLFMSATPSLEPANQSSLRKCRVEHRPIDLQLNQKYIMNMAPEQLKELKCGLKNK